jgi:hypothetical protein
LGALSKSLKPVTACKFGEVLNKYADDDDRATVADPRVRHSDIAEFVTQEWEPVGPTTVREHRAGKCICAKAN